MPVEEGFGIHATESVAHPVASALAPVAAGRRNTVPVDGELAKTNHRGVAAPFAVLTLLVASAVALALAPSVLDRSYSWVEHTTSEAGGQGVDGAWLARLGFLLFGLAVIWLAHARAGLWRQPATALHVAFGTCLLGVAAFSLRSWQDGALFDCTEDLLHSVLATAMGFAFALGVASVAWRGDRRRRRRPFDVVAIAASVIVPLAMTAWPDAAGALQRLMFAVAYLWYGREALDGLRPSGAEMARD